MAIMQCKEINALRRKKTSKSGYGTKKSMHHSYSFSLTTTATTAPALQ